MGHYYMFQSWRFWQPCGFLHDWGFWQEWWFAGFGRNGGLGVLAGIAIQQKEIKLLHGKEGWEQGFCRLPCHLRGVLKVLL